MWRIAVVDSYGSTGLSLAIQAAYGFLLMGEGYAKTSGQLKPQMVPAVGDMMCHSPFSERIVQSLSQVLTWMPV